MPPKINPLKSLVGLHLSKTQPGQSQIGLANTLKTGLMIGANAVQVYLTPRSNGRDGKPLPSKDIAECLKLKRDNGIYLAVHGKCIYNFCRTGSKWNWQHLSLEKELIMADQLESDVVVHQGKNVKDINCSWDQAIKNYVTNLQQVLDATSLKGCTNRILLENSCQQGTELGYTLEEFARIFNMFEPKYRSRLGICIDTCHIFVAGTLDMRSKDNVDDFFMQFDKLIGLDNLKLIHFNDSKVRYDGNVDRHMGLMCGFIANPLLGGNTGGFKQLSQNAASLNIPMVLETPGVVYPQDEIMLIRSWIVDQSQVETQFEHKYSSIIKGFATELSKTKPKPKPKPKPIAPKQVRKVVLGAVCGCYEGSKPAKPIVRIRVKKISNDPPVDPITESIDQTKVPKPRVRVKVKVKSKH